MSERRLPRARVEEDIFLSPDYAILLSETGLGELGEGRKRSLFNSFSARTRTTLQRPSPVPILPSGLAEDGGFAAFRVDAPPISEEQWAEVPDGTKSYVVLVDGESFRYFDFVKENGELKKERYIGHNFYEHPQDREVTLEELAKRISEPIISAHKSKFIPPPSINLGIALAFPHVNYLRRDGIDAVLSPLDDDGKLTKHWRITDWRERRKRQETSLIEAIKKQFGEKGIDPEKLKIVIENNTICPRNDVNTTTSIDQGSLAPVMVFGESGVNHALMLNDHSIVNLESGRMPLAPTDLTRRVLANIQAEKGEVSSSPDYSTTELEHEAGELYVDERFRAGIELLAEEGYIDPRLASNISRYIANASHKNPNLISQIAHDKTQIKDRHLRELAKTTLKRAGQFIGLSTAGIMEAFDVEPSAQELLVLSDGSFLHNAGEEEEEEKVVKDRAEATALEMGYKIKFIPASRTHGVAALAMTYERLRER